MSELEKLQRRVDEIRSRGGEINFTLGDDPGSLEDVAATINAMLDYAPSPTQHEG